MARQSIMTAVALVDYGMGNLLSVQNALETVGAQVLLCSSPEELNSAERVVLPGVGSFRRCMETIVSAGWRTALVDAVIRDRKPFLGICLGMQVLAERGFEGGDTPGLGWIEGAIRRMGEDDPALRVPHVGWNSLEIVTPHPLFDGIRPGTDFYFVHSFALSSSNNEAIVATCHYGCSFPAVVAKGNVFATQFHPEKSQDAGLRILDNFLNWSPEC